MTPVCHLTSTGETSECGQTMCEEGGLMLCPVHDAAATAQIRSKAF